MQMKLPPGQYELQEFPRFGLRKFAERFPRESDLIALTIAGEVERSVIVADEIRELERVDQTSDFHCVTTWSRRGLRWSGFRFVDFFERIVRSRARPLHEATFVVFRCQDGFAVGLPLADLRSADVLLADRLNDEPLSIAHGAPLRLVAPAHYGYKNPKHLRAVEFWRDGSNYRSPAFPFRFMDHPRARAALEERARVVPGWLARYLYRPLINPTIREFRRALEHRAGVDER
jgi:DMSO/TMAO reductase YedYZ molybdopterin-dependent catalytic subunit